MGTILNLLFILLKIVIGYFVLYAVIWLHEFGHAIFMWKFGVKKNPFQVSVNPSLFGSTPGECDIEKERKNPKWMYVMSTYGGIIANAVFVVISYIIIKVCHVNFDLFNYIIWLFMTLHMGEIISYMFFGNIYLVSDMSGIAANVPVLRWVNLVVGIGLTAVYVYMLSLIPANKIIIIIFNVVTILCMCLGRFIFTYKYEHAKTNK